MEFLTQENTLCSKLSANKLLGVFRKNQQPASRSVLPLKKRRPDLAMQPVLIDLMLPKPTLNDENSKIQNQR